MTASECDRKATSVSHNSVEDGASPRVPGGSRGRLWLRGLEVRLRFVFALALLAGVVGAWPWLKVGWERFVVRWAPHAGHGAVSADTEFFCPMDPGVISAWPAICPVCNMDLIPRKKTDAVLLPEGVVARMQLSPYRLQLAGVRTVPVESRPAHNDSDESTTLVIPAESVLQLGGEQIVYVETMPGMLEGVRVHVEPLEDGYCAVQTGLKPGQRVVAAGAFLVDAETRLNSSLATQYFGASGQSSQGQPPPPPKRRSAGPSAEPLSREDLALVERQRICPVTEAPLGSMGTPVFKFVAGRKVFLCCKGCEGRLLAEPARYLAILDSPQPPGRGSTSPQ